MGNFRNWIIAALLAAMPLAVLGGVLAQQQRVATTVDVRVWQSVASSDQFFVSIRSGGGSWAEAGTIPVSLGSLSESGAYRYGDLSVSLAMPAPPAPTQAPAATRAPTATATPTASPTATPAPGGDEQGGSAPGDGEQGSDEQGGGAPGGEETSPTRTIVIEPATTPSATAEPSPTAEPAATPSATPETQPAPDPDAAFEAALAPLRANLLRAENRLRQRRHGRGERLRGLHARGCRLPGGVRHGECGLPADD